MKKNYEHYNHAKYRLRYHIILSVKYHKRLLTPIIKDLKESLKRAEDMCPDWWIEYAETDIKNKKDHHIHLLVKAKPSASPFSIVSKIKKITTYDMWKKHGDYLSKFFCRKHHLWTRGYFIVTIGDVSEKAIADYISNQG